MISRYQTVNNGRVICKEYFYTCDHCSTEMFEGDSRYSGDGDYCPECAYLIGKIDAETFKGMCYWMPRNYNVGIFKGQIKWWTGDKNPKDKTNKDHRATAQYRAWRTSVFNRDKYTCQSCQQISGNIEAHHIKTFSKHPDSRFDITNGLTLCRPCHMKEHRKVPHAVV